MTSHRWPPPFKKDKNKEVILCPKCLQPGGVQLFTSISPCDACLNPKPEPVYEDTDPFGIFTLASATPVLPPGAVALGPIVRVARSMYGALATSLILPAGTFFPTYSKLTTLSVFPHVLPILTRAHLADHSWAVDVAGVPSVLSKITVGEILYAIP